MFKSQLTSITLILLFTLITGCYGKPSDDTNSKVMTMIYGQGLITEKADEQVHADLLLDLYMPKNYKDQKNPIVLIIHGGGFMSGSRQQPILKQYAEEFMRKGYIVASMDYRLLIDRPILSQTGTAVYDSLISNGLPNALSSVTGANVSSFMYAQITASIAAVEDSLTAILWLKRNTEKYNIDWDRFAVLGGSAGAITALNLAYYIDDDINIQNTPKYSNLPRIKAVVNHWGGYFSDPLYAYSIENGESALFTVHGTLDKTIKIRFSETLKTRAEQVGLISEFHYVPGGAHGFESIDVTTKVINGNEDTLFTRAVKFVDTILNNEDCVKRESTIDNC